MAIKLKRADLQDNIYHYTWERDEGDSAYTGAKDRVRIDKDEGYEVLRFIENFINDHDLSKNKVHEVEDALHSSDLSNVVMRDELIEKIEEKLKLQP